MHFLIERKKALLRSLSVDLSGKIYKEKQIIDLPAPVRRYFQNVLTDGQPYISTIYLKHDGQFKTAPGKNWINIEGEQHFTVEEPGFLWSGMTVFLSVQDMYIAGKGETRGSFLNLFNLYHGTGPGYDQGELLRWIGESVWFPTNLLPSQRLQWVPINENKAKLSLVYRGKALSCDVSFNTGGEITQLKTRRYMRVGRLETWVGRFSNYKEVDGMKIPMKVESVWKLPDGEHSYARFIIREIHHN